jgi:hypothetical protein
MGGYLACVWGGDENEVVARVAGGKMVWLGGLKDERGRWTWCRRTEMWRFKNWDGDVETSGRDTHLIMWRDGTWRSHSNGSEKGFVCEWEH